VITGGSSGIGAATARRLATDGWHCILLARGRERLERVAVEIGAEWEICDVGNREEMDETVRRIGERHSAVHLLVANAGVPGRQGFLELPPERIEEVVRTNYLGSVWAVRSFLPLLRAGAPSDVVVVASVAGVFAYGASGPYASAKHAQLAFARGAAADLARLGITVHAVNPGPVETEGFSQRRLLQRGLARRAVLRPEQVADAIAASVERGRTEVYVWRGYRLFGLAQGLIPGTLTRLAARIGRSG
jgi:uncharacterized protein